MKTRKKNLNKKEESIIIALVMDMEQKRMLKTKKGIYLTSGSEADIFTVEEGILKNFRRSVSLEVRRRKEKKLKYIETLTELKQYYPQIYYMVVSLINKNPKAYVMEEIYGEQIKNPQWSFQEKKNYLTQLRMILGKFKEEGCLYFDIRNPNIRIVNGKIVLLDIDGITTPEDPILDIVPTDLSYYLNNRGYTDHNGQIFMFNMLTKNCFQFTEKCYDRTASRILLDLSYYEPDSYGDHEYLLDHITPVKK